MPWATAKEQIPKVYLYPGNSSPRIAGNSLTLLIPKLFIVFIMAVYSKKKIGGLRQKSRYINTNSIDRIGFSPYILYVV
jgi:hypothetical protein